MVRYGVDTIIGDQIPIGAFLVRNHGRLFPDLGDLWAQHNESRKVFPRLLFFYLAKLSGWNVKWEMAAIFVMACAIAANVWILARRTIDDRVAATAAAAAAGVLIFSPVQWWNWLYGIQVVVFAPVLMLTTTLVVLGGRLTPGAKLLLASMAAIVATFSYANGLLVWIVLAPIAAATLGRRLTAVWIAVAGVAIAAYYAGYQRPPGHPPLSSPLDHPQQFALFVAANLGEPLAWARRIPVAAAIGLIAAVAFAALSIRQARHRRSWPWITIGMYAICSAGATAAGRASVGVRQALELRYTTFTIYLYVALIPLAFLAWSAPRLRALLVALLMAVHLAAAAATWPAMRANYRDALVAKAAVDLALVSVDHSALRQIVWPRESEAVETIDGLARIGYVDALRSPSIAAIESKSSVPLGAWNGVVRLADGGVGAWGWASLPDGRPADAVLIARNDQLVGVVPHTSLPRPDIGAASPELSESGWQMDIPRQVIAGGGAFSAWSYDTRTRHAYRLPGAKE